jgi:hypothetical protein
MQIAVHTAQMNGGWSTLFLSSSVMYSLSDVAGVRHVCIWFGLSMKACCPARRTAVACDFEQSAVQLLQ